MEFLITKKNQDNEGYWEAVRTLERLTSKKPYLAEDKLPKTLTMMTKAGLTLADVDKLSIIHVTGTKGKGSTGALCESILRAQGHKTGFFSSPHLIETRERFRINGIPITRDVFSDYFWKVFNKVFPEKIYDKDTSTKFRFLTIMAFQLFLCEKVDVVILEVGLGGEYDCTNVIRNPVVCGVTSLEVDHSYLLGTTLDSIAWHKSGIFKPGAPAVTVRQPEESICVFQKRAIEKRCPLYQVPDSIYEYDWCCPQKELGIPGEKQHLNASLAVQLCKIWTENRNKDLEARLSQYRGCVEPWKLSDLQQIESFMLSESIIKGLTQCSFPGRCTTVRRPHVTYYLDVAHTPRSIQACTSWFMKDSQNEAESISGKVVSVLLFNVTMNRSAEPLLQHLVKCRFHAAAFCPRLTDHLFNGDMAIDGQTDDAKLKMSRQGMACWLHQNTALLDETSPPPSAVTKTSIEALQWLTQGKDQYLPPCQSSIRTEKALQEADHIQVFCTGGFLVGEILGILDPHICDKQAIV